MSIDENIVFECHEVLRVTRQPKTAGKGNRGFVNSLHLAGISSLRLVHRPRANLVAATRAEEWKECSIHQEMFKRALSNEITKEDIIIDGYVYGTEMRNSSTRSKAQSSSLTSRGMRVCLSRRIFALHITHLSGNSL